MDELTGSKVMALRYAGRCRVCSREIAARERAVYERASKTVRCLECPATASELGGTPAESPAALPPTDAGTAGASARREYERRRARDEERLRAKWGRFGGIAVAFSEEKQSTSAWDRGAVGEERLGARLDKLASDGSIAVLHDRLIPGTRANIDHIVVTPGGVWVVDSKRYHRQTPVLRVEGGLFRPRVEKLVVGGRDRTRLVDGVLGQVAVVREALPDVPVTGALCFIDAEWPLIGGAFVTRGVLVLWPKRLVKRLSESRGELDVGAMTATLAARFIPA